MSDRKALIRLASSLPKGSKERKAILVGLKKVPTTKQARGESFGQMLDQASRHVHGAFMDELIGGFKWVAKPKMEHGYEVTRNRYDEITVEGMTKAGVVQQDGSDGGQPLKIVMELTGHTVTVVSTLGSQRRKGTFGILPMTPVGVAVECFNKQYQGLVP